MNPSLLTNPLVLRMVVVFFASAFLFVVGILVIRHLRREVLGGSEQPRTPVDRADFQLTAYHGVIQRLKEQEQELQNLRRQAADKAAASQNLSDVVLANLS